MRSTHLFIILSLYSLIIIGIITDANSSAQLKTASDKNSRLPFAVVELFTSEGCSSCPPADELLGDIIAQARKNNQNIFALAFHVDYWDYIGWKDPYAKKIYSDRQRKYAQAFRSSRIYTPQMIVNGKEEFIGSNRHQAKSAIKSALSQSARAEVSLKLNKLQADDMNIEYAISEFLDEAMVHFALVERDLVQNVKRGENSGRVLKHENVVRSFETVTSKSGVVSLEVPTDMTLENSSIIAYVQNSATMEILGAGILDF